MLHYCSRNICRKSWKIGSKSFSLSVTASQNQVKDMEKEIKDAEEYLIVERKPKKKLTQHTPFAKGLFMGKFDKNLLEYPEFETTEELKDLEAMCQPISRLFERVYKEDGQKLEEEGKLSERVLSSLKKYKLFGLNVPQEYGGLDLSPLQYARICEEISLDPSIAVTLHAHQDLGLKTILNFGSVEQKEKYLSALSSGEKICSFCLTEKESGSDAASVKSTANLNEEKTHYILNGEKLWVTNGSSSDVFIVFAKAPIIGLPNEEMKVTAFIVEKDFGGITANYIENKHALTACDIAHVEFKDTVVPLENVIGEVGDGFKIAIDSLNSSNFALGSVCGMLKRILKDVTDHVISRQQFGRPLMDYGLIQQKLAWMAASIYCLESALYFTAGILDNYHKPDATVELAMLKLFSSETAFQFIHDATQILGGQAYIKSHNMERFIRDSRILTMLNGTNDIAKLFISLQSLQYVGRSSEDDLKKIRDIYNQPKKIWNLMKSKSFRSYENPRCLLKLYNHVHPSVALLMEKIEKKLMRFQSLVEKNLVVFGNGIVEQQYQLGRLAEISTTLFVLSASAARASRSLCIGLRNADHELRLACLYGDTILEDVEVKLNMLSYGTGVEIDANAAHISDAVCKNGGYAADHPLAKNW
ncbi:DgyrCDS10601 [Dimorphilus gyrociliatus]|uniref:DgyrCDS10601 n=1 Tax=Dimorphilus gyrociliatus TaxID=2664684 RepID=A0A7I8W0U2_9ANNE|nr:DgyrCDS10601 [Dimorphilus gyrociliatus]